MAVHSVVVNSVALAMIGGLIFAAVSVVSAMIGGLIFAVGL